MSEKARRWTLKGPDAQRDMHVAAGPDLLAEESVEVAEVPKLREWLVEAVDTCSDTAEGKAAARAYRSVLDHLRTKEEK